jgi:hypothetical protein
LHLFKWVRSALVPWPRLAPSNSSQCLHLACTTTPCSRTGSNSWQHLDLNDL